MDAEGNTVIEDFQRQLPPFLTSAKKQEILDAIKDFPEKFNPYQYVKEDPFAEQGDIFADVPFYFYENNKKEHKIAMVLSNACDISPENKRYAPVKVITALLLKFDRFSDLIRRNLPSSSAESIERDIKSQKITNMMYLPKGAALQEDYILKFDCLTSIPLKEFLTNRGERLARLSLFGYYMLLFKLSVHFCRFPERS